MVLIILFTSYMVYRNAERYASYDSKTKIWEEKTPERALPVITICMQSSYLRNVFCYNNKPLSNFLKSCDKTEPNKHKMQIYNGSDYIEPRYLGNDCYVVNENGTIALSVEGEYQRVWVWVKDSSVKYVFMVFQSQEEFKSRKENFYLTQFHQLLMLYRGTYKIHITEKHVSSLPSPYASNCKDRSASNMFSDIYTYSSCRESCAYNKMYEECNATVDLWTKYNLNQVFDNNSQHVSLEVCKRVCEPSLFREISKM